MTIERNRPAGGWRCGMMWPGSSSPVTVNVWRKYLDSFRPFLRDFLCDTDVPCSHDAVPSGGLVERACMTTAPATAGAFLVTRSRRLGQSIRNRRDNGSDSCFR